MDYNLDLMVQYHVSLLGTVVIIIIIRILAVLIPTKTNEDYSQVMCNIRTRLSMDIMRSVLVAVRGVHGKSKKAWIAPISNVSFNLIPEERSYEG